MLRVNDYLTHVGMCLCSNSLKDTPAFGFLNKKEAAKVKRFRREGIPHSKAAQFIVDQRTWRAEHE